MNEEEIDTIEESFENIPEEVKRYIYSTAFLNTFQKLCSEKGLTPEESNALKTSLFSYLAQIDTEESLIETINKISKSPEINQQIISWVTTNVTDKILELTTETLLNQEDGLDINTEESSAPSPTQAMESIKDRLSQNTKITPTKRDYSMEKAENSTPSVQNITKPSVDPYRELPEKE
jgi:hypothetical protein